MAQRPYPVDQYLVRKALHRRMPEHVIGRACAGLGDLIPEGHAAKGLNDL